MTYPMRANADAATWERSNSELASERALIALESLLESCLDRSQDEADCLRERRRALLHVRRCFHELHDALKVRALGAPKDVFFTLAAHAERRELEDRQALDQLARLMAGAQPSCAVSRAVALSVLSLLANLSREERVVRALDLPSVA